MKRENYQRRYTREFKEEAVRLLLTTDKSVKDLARELGTSHVSLLNWKEQALHPENGAKPGKPDNGVRLNYAVLEQENIRLRKEVETLRREREILKKSLGIFSQDPLREGMRDEGTDSEIPGGGALHRPGGQPERLLQVARAPAEQASPDKPAVAPSNPAGPF